MAISVKNNGLGTVREGPGTMGTRVIEKDYPVDRGLVAGTTKHLVDSVDYDEEVHG